MFAKLIEIALKSALENPEIKERLRIKNEEVKVNLMKQENNQNKIIDLDINDYKVFENDY